MAAAGGDLFVVLALPRHYRTEQAIRYTQRLRAVRQPPAIADVDAFEFTETRALSYGTIYFPWLQSDVRLAPGDREASDARLRVPAARVPPRIVPPDGVSLGVLAARATKRGAWVAPANEPLQDVVGVTPPIAGAD
jgi:hypothetical protein